MNKNKKLWTVGLAVALASPAVIALSASAATVGFAGAGASPSTSTAVTTTSGSMGTSTSTTTTTTFNQDVNNLNTINSNGIPNASNSLGSNTNSNGFNSGNNVSVGSNNVNGVNTSALGGAGLAGVNGTFFPTGGRNNAVVTGSGFTGVSGWGSGGGMENIQRFMPNPARTSIAGPMQLTRVGGTHEKSHARPIIVATREIFTNGVPTTVSSPVLTEYSWPSESRTNARVYTKRKAAAQVTHRTSQRRILK